MSLPPDIHTPALPYPEGSLLIESLDLEARGVARREDGKVVFVEGALPFERVSASVNRRKNNWEQASLVAIHRESSQRVVPHCAHFGLHTGSCGGCKMQHLHPAAQVAVKQRVLEDNLWHLGKVKPETMLRPIEGPAWHTVTERVCRSAMFASGARCWWDFMSAKATMWPTFATVRCCQRR